MRPMSDEIFSPCGVYFQSDGRFYPDSNGPLAWAYIAVDGVRVTDNSTINWGGSTLQEQHSFEVVGASNLSSGSHTVQLIVVSSSAIFVGASTNLVIMTKPATRVSQSSLS